MSEIIGNINLEEKKKGKSYVRTFSILGYDEYGRYQSEVLVVPPFGQEVHTKYKYAILGYRLPDDFVPKIGEWFWK